MPLSYQSYKNFEHGVVNAIEPSAIPVEAVHQSQNFYYRENFWRKIPGLVEIHNTAIGTHGVWGLTRFYQILPKSSLLLAASGTDIYKFTPGANTWTSIRSTMSLNSQVEFLEYQNKAYMGSQTDLWRAFDGGAITYPVGGNNGNASDAPRKFSEIIYNPYAGRFFGIGELNNPDYLYWSEHTDNEGIEKWPDGNIQIVQSDQGDVPKKIDTFEGRITIISDHSIHSGSVVGVPANWSFDREKAQSGAIARRTVKRYGSSFFMLSPEFELYQWPQDKFVSKGRVKFKINEHFAHLASAAIMEDRYYVLAFRSSEQVSSNRYHLWYYDILGDRFYGPHIGFNAVSLFYDKENRILLMGGENDLAGFVMEHRGKNIKNVSMSCHWIGSYSDYGFPRIEKRYTKLWLKARQEGSLASGEGQVELIVNTDNRHDQPQSQRIVLEDQDNDQQNVMDTGSVKEAVTKKAYIPTQFGRGNAVQVEIKHNVLNGDFEFSEFDVEYYVKRYQKANRET